jgi:hypothetical protein
MEGVIGLGEDGPEDTESEFASRTRETNFKDHFLLIVGEVKWNGECGAGETDDSVDNPKLYVRQHLTQYELSISVLKRRNSKYVEY